MRPLCLIVNPSAGGGRAARALPAVEAALRAGGATPRVELTASLDHAGALAREALARGEVAVSFGGDGLAGRVAHELRGTGGVLGVLPGGRGNDFARKLGIASEPVAACATLLDGAERVVDAAEVDSPGGAGGRTFLGIASYGFDSDVQDVANATRLPLGRLVYVYSALAALRRWRPTRLDFAGRSTRGYAVAVCNSGVFGGGMRVAPDADLADGLLDVVVSHDVPRLHYLRSLPKVFRGTHLADPSVELFRVAELTVDAERPFRIYADGDPIGETPATIRALPGALRVLVPG